ncbi:putative metallophosphoesterase [Paenibacillus konkukensis]|uniref:Metallophosphoesterase n=1 Tax=Paenibacillus konkukensis TaxID=2020716 RepID=A0ABY4RYN5_9BACL|nr:metallophosphoesterase [Paenibacillus konkukensis]UQZ87525.1 putative metallophosphoesterase [Paenibacillus konkukensis]
MNFIPVLLLFVLINGYIGGHGAFLLAHYGAAFPMTLYWVLFAVLVFSYLIGRSRLLKGPLGRLLKVIGSYYFAVMEFAFLLLIAADLIALTCKLAGAEPGVYIPVLAWGAAAVLVILLLRGSWNSWTPVVRKYELQVNKQVRGMKELRVLVASDIHLGNIVGKRHLSKLVKHAENTKPDLILLPGDVIDDSIEPYIRNGMSEVMRRLKAPLGTYAVLGNHEYYGGHIEEYVKQMEAIGIKVLRDETVGVQNAVLIAGRKDRTAERSGGSGRLSAAELLKDADSSRPIIMMDHQPYQFAQTAAAGVDVLLCGHTHRGQFAPNHWITRRLFELDWGYMRKEAMHVVVSSGFGSWGPPIRLASRSEIVELVIRFD